MNLNIFSPFKFFLLFVAVSISLLKAEDPLTTQQPDAPPASPGSEIALTPFFLDIDALEIAKVLPPPPGAQPTEENSATPKQGLTREEDLFIQECATATATQEEKDYAMRMIEDSVFDFSEVLGANFTAEQFPLTKAFFDKVCNDTNIACTAAKNLLQGSRPPTWTKMSPDDLDFGYTYPSGHTARAFLCAELLSLSFPQYKEALLKEAEKKAWSRVIIGRHYPSDVYAGKIYAEYLFLKFLENTDFQNEWTAAQKEITEKSSLLITIN